jgi:hypothetical protein
MRLHSRWLSRTYEIGDAKEIQRMRHSTRRSKMKDPRVPRYTKPGNVEQRWRSPMRLIGTERYWSLYHQRFYQTDWCIQHCAAGAPPQAGLRWMPALSPNGEVSACPARFIKQNLVKFAWRFWHFQETMLLRMHAMKADR